MRKKSVVYITWPLACLFFLLSNGLSAQELSEETGLPGDHFSLEEALELFKQAESPENFEALLNATDNTVNNLDLNEDGQVDYIRVEDHQDGEVHAIVLQVPVDQKESQDIAVIEIERQGEGEAILQIVGDESIYGEQVIVEPTEVSTSPNPSGKGGPAAEVAVARVIVNVWLWPSVRFIYRPSYRVYVSPYRWGVYPTLWRPWRPRPWNTFRARIVPRPHFRVVTTHRVVRAHRVYAPRRTHSVVVHRRTTTRVAARNQPRVANKTTKTTVVKRNNGATRAGAQKKTTTVRKTNRGKTVTKQRKTTVKKRRR